MSHHYTATHSTGTVHLRKSDRPYTHAAVGETRNTVSWSGRPDLARKAADSLGKYAHGVEVVPAAEVTAAEFAALTKASKRHFKTVYDGKTYTKTTDAGYAGPAPTAVGYHDIEHVERQAVPEGWAASAAARVDDYKGYAAKFPGRGYEADTARAEEHLVEVQSWVDRGYHEVKHREQKGVYWIYAPWQRVNAQAGHCTAAFKFRTELVVTEVSQ